MPFSQVKCDARIGEAEARKDAGIREARAEVGEEEKSQEIIDTN